MLAVSAFAGFWASEAVAAHWHFYNNVDHGIVHGDYTRDGSFFGRTDSNWLSETNYCAVGDLRPAWGFYASSTTWATNLCSLWSKRYGNTWDECQAISSNAVTNKVAQHTHYGHHYPGAGSCVAYSA